jgi:RHS repeat-associated protein
VQQELRAHVYIESGALDARLVLTDARGRAVRGPATAVAGGKWYAVRLPSAHVDPAYKVSRVSLELTTPASAPAYTGPVWLDHVLVMGVAESLTDSKPAPYTTARMGYDWNANATTVSRPNTSGAQISLTYTYNRFGQVTATKDSLGHDVGAEYDDFLRLTKVTSVGTGSYSYSYYPNSNEIQTYTSSLGTTERQGVDTSTGDVRYQIDERNEDRRLQKLDYVATVYVYDGSGNLTSQETNRYAPDTDSTIDLEQRPLPAPLETLRRTDYTYGSGGVVTSVTDANRNVTNYTYDSLTGYLTRIDAPAGGGETNPDGSPKRRVTTITRNADGSVREALDPKGQTTAYVYDGLGRLKRTNYGVVNGAPAFSSTYTLDANGNMAGMTDKAGSSSWTYDENGRLTSESRTQNGATKTASYSYFANGLLKSRTTPEGKTVSYGYDSAMRLVSQTDPNDLDASGNPRTITYSYDAQSLPLRLTYPSGVAQERTYDTTGAIDLITLKDSAGTLLQKFDYDYGLITTTNPDGTVTVSATPNYRDGSIIGVEELDGSRASYNYDDLGRLAKVTRTGSNPYTESYTYDGNGNRTTITRDGVTTTATYDTANQLTKRDSTSYSYDRNGSMLGFGSNTLTYDAANRWTGGTINGQSVAFGYDGQGRRVSRSLGGARTDYWYDSTGLSLETGQASAAYQRGEGGILLSISSGGTTRNYSHSYLGTIMGLITTGGRLSDSYSYDPWGRPTGTTGTTYNPHRYTGTYLDEATGLYQMGARYYDPDSGRFTQQDPHPGQMFGDRYAYVGGDPVNKSDPTGLFHAGCDIDSVDLIRNRNNVLIGTGSASCWDANPVKGVLCIRKHWHRRFLPDRWLDLECLTRWDALGVIFQGDNTPREPCQWDAHYSATLWVRGWYHWGLQWDTSWDWSGHRDPC